MKKWTPIAAIAAIFILVLAALILGKDGAILSVGIGIIAGLGGYTAKGVKQAKSGTGS